MHDQGWGVIPSTSRVSAVSISVRITGICVNEQCSDATSAGRPRNGMTSTCKGDTTGRTKTVQIFGCASAGHNAV